MSNPVDGPLSTEIDNIPVFDNTTGNLLADSGVNINTGIILADGIELNYIFGTNDRVSFEYTRIYNPGLITFYGVQGSNESIYDTGLFTQSGHIVTGTSTSWTQDMVGGLMTLDNDNIVYGFITKVNSATELVLDSSFTTGGGGTTYRIHYGGLSMSPRSVGALGVYTSNLVADTISEKTVNGGCTVDNLLIKDGCQEPSVNSTTYSFTNTTGTLNIKLQKLSSNIVVMTVPSGTLTKTVNSGYIVNSTTWPTDYTPSSTQRFFPVCEVGGTRQSVSISLNYLGQFTIAKDITGTSFSSGNTFAFQNSGEQTFEYHL